MTWLTYSEDEVARFHPVFRHAADQALRLDAACVVVNLMLLSNQPEFYHQCVANVCALKEPCERFGMPLMVEPLVMQPNERGGGYMVDGDLEKMLPLVRQAVELGADIIKADPCDNPDEYHRVIEVAGGVRQPVTAFAQAHPDTRLIAERFMAIEQAMGTPRGRDAGTAYLSRFIEEMKASGFVARALKASGQGDATVAPPA